MANCKKISIDFHGVINTAPDFFAALMGFLQENGVKVYVVSGGPHAYIQKYLAEHLVPYDELWCIFDYFNAREKVKVAADGSFHIDDELWNKAKGDFCACEQIGVHVDDSTIYGKYFTTPYVRFNTSERNFEIDGATISIDNGAEKIADALIHFSKNI